MRNRKLTLNLGFTLAAAFLVILFHPVSLRAQLTRGSIAGTVRDESGAVVPGATVRITRVGTTNLTRDMTTDDKGFYRVGALDPGTYSVVIEKGGFQRVENREVVVNVSLETTFDATLKPGNVAATVDVTSQTEAIELNKTNGTIGLTVTSRQVVELPLSAGRNINNLALLSPNAFSGPGSSGISVNGQRARNNNFTIDGSDNNDISVTLPTTPVFPEAVGEFQVQTNPYSVEFGRNSGAQINVITRSGTNRFHGDLFEYYGGSALNSLTNIEKQASLTRPARFNRNQFGFDIGGPIFLPRFGEGGRALSYNGRDRTFFFYAFQGDLTRTGNIIPAGNTVRIPTPAGFAALNTVPLRAATANAPAQTLASRQAVLNSISFLNNIYALNPTFRSRLSTDRTNCINGIYVPATANRPPQCVGGVFVETALTNIGLPQPVDQYTHILRIDHKLTNNDNLTGRYISNKPNQPNLVSNLEFSTLFAGAQQIFDQNLALSETHVFSPRVLNEFRFSYIRRNLQFPENDPRTPSTAIRGLFDIGGFNNFPQGRIQNSFQYSDTLSWQPGRHALKFGVDFRRIQLFNLAAFDTKGTFTFNNLTDFLNNNAVTFVQALQTATFDARQLQQFYFVQDDYRVRPNLTLNLGLRYEYSSVPFGFFGATDPQSLAALVPGPVKPDKDNFAPSFGFSYSPSHRGGLLGRLLGDGTTVFRGGYRIAYDILFYNILTVNASNFPRVVVGQQNNVLDVFPNLLRVSGAPKFDPLATYVNTPTDAQNPKTELYSFSVQRELHRDFVLEFGYTGSHSLNGINQLQANPAVLSPADIAAVQAAIIAQRTNPNINPSAAARPLQSRRIFPQFGSRVLIATTAQSTYNAGYVTLNKRFSRGLQFGVSYTRSKLLSDNDESLGVGAITTGSPQIPQDFFNIKAEKGLSAFDRTNRFVANFIYQVPTPRFAKNSSVLRQIFGGFEVSGVVQHQSGQPFTILTGVDSNGNGAGGDRPNFDPAGQIIPDPSTHDLRTFTTSGNPFIVPRGNNGLPVAFSLGNGNLGRDTYRGPAFNETDLSVQKSIIITESKRLIFRADFFNALKQRNFGIPVVSLNSVDFGKNLSDAGRRAITLSGKFTF